MKKVVVNVGNLLFEIDIPVFKMLHVPNRGGRFGNDNQKDPDEILTRKVLLGKLFNPVDS